MDRREGMESLHSAKIYCGRPYHSMDRGSNENFNRLIQRYVKNGANIGKICRDETERIKRKINDKLRGIFG